MANASARSPTAPTANVIGHPARAASATSTPPAKTSAARYAETRTPFATPSSPGTSSSIVYASIATSCVAAAMVNAKRATTSGAATGAAGSAATAPPPGLRNTRPGGLKTPLPVRPGCLLNDRLGGRRHGPDDLQRLAHRRAARAVGAVAHAGAPAARAEAREGRGGRRRVALQRRRRAGAARPGHGDARAAAR